jgi:hypothetical protein
MHFVLKQQLTKGIQGGKLPAELLRRFGEQPTLLLKSASNTSG